MKTLLLETEDITVHIIITNESQYRFNETRYTIKRYIDHIFVTENGWTDRGWFNMYRYGKKFNI